MGSSANFRLCHPAVKPRAAPAAENWQELKYRQSGIFWLGVYTQPPYPIQHATPRELKTRRRTLVNRCPQTVGLQGKHGRESCSDSVCVSNHRPEHERTRRSGHTPPITPAASRTTVRSHCPNTMSPPKGIADQKSKTANPTVHAMTGTAAFARS